MNCVYCGCLADTRDHVIPLSYSRSGNQKDRRRHQWRSESKNLVDACRECNSLAGDKVFTDVDEKREYIQQRLEYRYRRILDMPVWSDKEINEMGYNLKRELKLKTLARKWIENRIHHPNILWTDAEPSGEMLRYLSDWNI